jgi:hypothetical protein
MRTSAESSGFLAVNEVIFSRRHECEASPEKTRAHKQMNSDANGESVTDLLSGCPQASGNILGVRRRSVNRKRCGRLGRGAKASL